MRNDIKRENIEHEIDFLISKLENYFGKKIDGYEIDPDNDYPMVGFDIKFTLYNYYSCKLAYGVSKLGFYITSGDGSSKVIVGVYANLDLDEYIENMDREVRLRIPDKYLKDKGWE